MSEQVDGFLRVSGASEHNLRNVDVAVPRDAIVVFSGVSGSGKSSLAFGTIYAESQRRYLESVAPYARRLIEQVGAPRVGDITGLPPAIALQQRRGAATTRSSVGTVTTLSNTLRMLMSRAGRYPEGAAQLDSDWFSPNTVVGACPECHGVGSVHRVTEASLVPDPGLSIRDKAIAAWPGAWLGKNYRDILAELGYDIDRPWRELPQAERDWILFTDEQPVVTVHPVRTADKIQRDYQGTYASARRYVLHTYASTHSNPIRKRVARFLVTEACPLCHGSRLRAEALAITFAGKNIHELAGLPLTELAGLLGPVARTVEPVAPSAPRASGQVTEVALTLVRDLIGRIEILTELGLGYLALDRATTTLSAGELQRLRLARQLRAGLFGVLYVLDEPSAGLHPADSRPLIEVLDRLRASGNSLLIVEHDLDVMRRADWLVDVGPGAGEHGGQVLFSGPPAGLSEVPDSVTGRYLRAGQPRATRPGRREPAGWLGLAKVSRHNLVTVDVGFPLGVFTVVTGVSGSGKSSLVSQVLVEVVAEQLGAGRAQLDDDDADWTGGDAAGAAGDGLDEYGFIDDSIVNTEAIEVTGLAGVDRLVRVDQKPIGRTPRSNLATYTGLFDSVRKAFADTGEARDRGYTAGRFSFNVKGGRCENCQGAGTVSVELLFLPGSHGPCPVCHGRRYNPETLRVRYRGRSIAEVLELTVEQAEGFLADLPAAARSLATLRQVGLDYLRLGQPATELSGGEAQRIKLSRELQRAQRGHTLYVLDEPTTGLHPADVDVLMAQLHSLVDAGNTVVVVEHDMAVAAGADWIVDLGPGGGEQGGQIIAAGPPELVAGSSGATAGYLAAALAEPGRTVSAGEPVSLG